MVRRWSCLIDINSNFDNNSFFKKRYKLYAFRTSIKYRRYIYKITKFRRKSLIRIKHRTNWRIYTNVLKLWVRDYSFNKHLARYQFFNKIFINNFFFYNFNFVKNRNVAIFYNFNFIFSVLTNKNYYYHYKNKSFNFNFTPSTVAWLNTNPVLNKSVLPVYNCWGNIFYLYNSERLNILDACALTAVPFLVALKKNEELKKILTILFYTHLSKLKNVK